MAKKESVDQIETVLRDVESSSLTIALHLLAMNQDKNFDLVDQRLEKVDEKLNQIIELIGLNKKSTDDRIEELKLNTEEKINIFKLDSKSVLEKEKNNITIEINKLKQDTESISYFNSHPKVFKVFVVALTVVIISFCLGRSDYIDKLF